MGIAVVDYDPSWPEAYQAISTELCSVTGGLFAAIEHVGSTAVVGLSAKPIIDVMAAVRYLDAVDPFLPKLAGIGYQLQDTAMPNRLLLLRAVPGLPTSHLHVVTVDGWDTRNQRLFRDHLRDHPDLATEYGQLKAELAGSSTDGDEYTSAKTEFVQRVVDAARTARGLPLVSVWEE